MYWYMGTNAVFLSDADIYADEDPDPDLYTDLYTDADFELYSSMACARLRNRQELGAGADRYGLRADVVRQLSWLHQQRGFCNQGWRSQRCRQDEGGLAYND